MAKGTRFVGMDVHAETIAVAVAEAEIRPVRWGRSPTDRRRSGGCSASSTIGTETEQQSNKSKAA